MMSSSPRPAPLSYTLGAQSRLPSSASLCPSHAEHSNDGCYTEGPHNRALLCAVLGKHNNLEIYYPDVQPLGLAVIWTALENTPRGPRGKSPGKRSGASSAAAPKLRVSEVGNV